MVLVDSAAPWISPPMQFVADVVMFAVLIPIIVRFNVSDVLRAKREAVAALEALVDDRRVLARELHDSIAQHLCYLHMKLDGLTRENDCDGVPGVAAELEQMRDAANEAYEDIYCLISSLRLGPSGDLADTLEARAMLAGERGSFKTNVTRAGEPRKLVACHQQEIVSIVREALANVQKHAQATRADITVNWMADTLGISVSDDGRGFDPAQNNRSEHFGLNIMKERAAEIGGSLHVRSLPMQGTVVEFSVPLDRISEPAEQPCP